MVSLGMRKLSMDELQRLSVNEFRQSEKIPVVVVLDNIRSMHNVGSVFRTADAFLLRGIYLCGACTHPGGSVIAINGRNAAMAVLADSLNASARATIG